MSTPFEKEFPEEAQILMDLKGKLFIHIFSNGKICEHNNKKSWLKTKTQCPICGQYLI
jgi:hypothetical protein